MRILPEVLRVLIKGPFTEKYPRVESPAAPGYRGRVRIDPEECFGCGTCARACPTGAIVLREGDGEIRVEVLYGTCTLCGKCVEVCPYDAVSIVEDYEHFSRDPEAKAVEVELKARKCRLCGRPIAPIKLMNRIQEKLEEEGLKEAVALLDLCPACREKLSASVMSRGFPHA